MAFFPAEVLVCVYRTLGDVRDLLSSPALNDVLVFVAVAMLLLALPGCGAGAMPCCGRSAPHASMSC